MNIKSYLVNTYWLLLERSIRLFSGLFVGILVARYLGPEQYGVLNFAIGFTSLFGAVAALGLDAVIVRELVNNKNNKNTLLGTAFIIKLLATVVMWFMILIVTFLLGLPVDEVTMIFVVSFATVFQSINVIDFFFQSEVKSKYVAKLLLLQLLVSAMVKVYLVFVNAPLYYFAFVFTLEAFIYSLGLIILNKLMVGGRVSLWRWDKVVALRLFREGLPYIFAGMAISAYLKIDLMMVKMMLGNSSAGIYSVAARLSESWYFLPVVIVSSFFPAVIQSKTLGEEVYYRRISAICGLLVFSSMLLAVPTSFLSDTIIEYLYGREYVESAGVLVIHIWCTVFVFLGVVSHRWYVAEGKQYLALKRALSGLVLNICLNYFLIPEFGVSGAALATLISQFFVSYFLDILNKETRQLFWAKTMCFCFFYDVIKKRSIKEVLK